MDSIVRLLANGEKRPWHGKGLFISNRYVLHGFSLIPRNAYRVLVGPEILVISQRSLGCSVATRLLLEI